MHQLLQRQLKRHIGQFENIPEDWQDFVDAVDEAYHQADARTGILFDISYSLSAAEDEDEMLQILARPAIEAGVNSARLLYFDLDETGEPEWAELVADWRREGEPQMSVGSRFYLPDLPAARRWVASPDEAQLISDTATEGQVNGYVESALAPSVGCAEVIVPLRQAGRWVGVIIFAWDEPHEFAEREAQVYNALVGLASLAVASRRQFERAQARVRREQLLREITSRVRSFTDPEAIARAAVRELGAALGRSTFVRLGSAEELSRAPVAQRDSGDGRDMV
jgi:GAF domain-containing protein